MLDYAVPLNIELKKNFLIRNSWIGILKWHSHNMINYMRKIQINDKLIWENMRKNNCAFIKNMHFSKYMLHFSKYILIKRSYVLHQKEMQIFSWLLTVILEIVIFNVIFFFQIDYINILYHILNWFLKIIKVFWKCTEVFIIHISCIILVSCFCQFSIFCVS